MKESRRVPAEERNVEAFLAALKLMEAALDPGVVDKYHEHELGTCHGSSLRDILNCPNRGIEGRYYAPLRWAIPMLGRARYRPAIPLLSRMMVEGADTNCQREAAAALNRIVNGPEPPTAMEEWLRGQR